MAKSRDKRVEKLERDSGGDHTLIVMDWGTGIIELPTGGVLSVDEFKRLYPNCKVVSWGEDEDQELVPVA